jgi:Putative zinc-finger
MTNPRFEERTHLSPETVAGYLDGDLPREQLQQVELHLASCDECRIELAELRRLQRGRLRRQWARLLIPAVAAAALVFAFVIPRGGTKRSDVRSGSNVEERLGVVSPPPSAEIGPGPIEFVWHAAGPGASYVITLQEPDGRPVWTSALSDTTAVVPDSIPLVPGNHWWFVDALLPNGRSVSTGVQRLTRRP